jgi:signal transduction histidine kinase
MYSLGGTTMGVAIVSDLSKINDLYESEQSRTFGATAREAAEARAMELFEINERLVETQNQLLQSQKMEAIGQLAGGVAHDFNNLLSIINGQAELLLEGEEACPSSAGLRQILNAGRQAAAVTQQLLAFSRKQVFDTQVVDLNVVIADVERLVSRFIDASIELHVIADSEPRWVEIDVVQLQQIILNLALNARDAMPQGGSLTVEAKRLVPEDRALAIADARRKGAHACLTVSDTGEGMSPHTLAHLFEPFFTTKSLGAGTGLGLSTVHGIVEQSHGFIEVQSELGVGSCISVFLPSAEGPASITDAGREALHTGSDSATEQNDDVRARTEVILLAEDNDEIRRFIAQVLRGRGYLVIESKNGREAAERLAEPGASAIQLVLSDVAMPEMGGRELALHVARVHPSVRVILMSGYAPDAIDGQLLIGSSLGFLQKPFPTRDLLSKIEEYL